MNETPLPLLCVLGPTASGKTRIAAHLASIADGEVISADSRQVYRRMNIGTGKDLFEYFVGETPIPTHLIDVADPGYEYNVFEFKRDCVAAIQDIHSRRRLAILCGGSGLYLSAVLQGYELLPAPADPERRSELEATPTAKLISELRSHGPLHNTSDISDRKRLIRAIEVAESGAETRQPDLTLDSIVCGVAWDRDVLRARISERLEQRLAAGLLEEVRGLLESGLTHDQIIFYGLEYRYVTEHLRGDLTYERMFDALERAIQRFAKRQATWFRRMERQGLTIHWLDGRDSPEANARRALELFRARRRSG